MVKLPWYLLSLSIVCIAFLASSPAPTNREAPVDAPSATVRVKSSLPAGTKTLVRCTGEFRCYAEDGSYLIPTETEFIDFSPGDDVHSDRWFIEGDR